MKSAHERLAHARAAAGYTTATAAAQAMGVGQTTYINHENGERGLSRAGPRYASFFRVRLEWLLHGKGDMRERRSEPEDVPVMGYVGAGAHVSTQFEAPPEMYVSLPDHRRVMALVVRGESMWPRFLDGEHVIVDRDTVPADAAVDCYCVIETEPDGDALLKILHRGSRPGTWKLWSHNAPEVDNVAVRAVRLVRGVLPPDNNGFRPGIVRMRRYAR
jgi:phage repressor protein C with HTH and peptisase S24 domain